MRKPIYLLLLISAFIISCHKAQPDPDGPDLATTIAGNWKTYYCTESDGDPNACHGSLSLTRIDATHLSGDFKISSGSPFISKCTIEVTEKDTIFGCDAGGYGYYRNGKIQMHFADGLLEVRFKRE